MTGKQIDKRVLRMIRAVNDMSQLELAKFLKVSPSLISKIRTGEKQFTQRTADRVVYAFNLDVKSIEHINAAIKALIYKENNG
ncbi:helix-turn-helix transcriptional regulator [Priestia megaterium]|uniref:helix-turn-helix transcriptional regulator n=1 Tax=Priestia megaterium TaxID=1404 RepID=UPI00196B7BDF|nr:helix-turn-helix transcriptional regulator [Priestia megaterium]QSF36959.1 helix-turn-helix transcriptional regulator [Priestia megaterium]